MKPKLLLRIAAAVMLLHTVGHSIGALTWKQAPNPAVADVIRGMENNRFDFLGRQVTLAEFFQGYGIGNIFVLLFITITLWLLGGNTKDRLTQQLLPFLIVFLVCFSLTEWVYFFPMPSIMSMVAAILSLLAYRRIRQLAVAG
jgi:hypothetical protein